MGSIFRSAPGMAAAKRWARGATAAKRPARAARPRSLSAALAGKRVVITGGSSGIGSALAHEAARHGAEVLLVARRREQLSAVCAEIEAAGGKARLFCADLSSADECQRLLEELRAVGSIDVLINNAGRSIRRSVRHAYDRAHDFERTMALNYFGSLRMILGILPDMRARGRGHVINISSAGVLFKSPRFAAYVASKAALDAFTEVAATEAYADGVHFTTVHMPLVRTPMIAPTRAYRRAPALTPTEAARLALSALVSQKPHVTPLLAGWTAASRALFPTSARRVINAIYQRTAGSKGRAEATGGTGVAEAKVGGDVDCRVSPATSGRVSKAS